MERKGRFGASGYTTIYGLLIFVFHGVGIPGHAMCCEQIVIFNFRHSSRELGEAGCSWIHLLFNLWKAPKASS